MLQSPLNADADNAGAIFSTSLFNVPRFQRQYAWGMSELEDFWNDLKDSLDSKSDYFLGLIILTESGKRKQIVDGQQRLLTLSLLAASLYHTSIRIERHALADKIASTFLYHVDFQTDEEIQRIHLSDPASNDIFRRLLDARESHALLSNARTSPDTDGSSSERLIDAYRFLTAKLKSDLKDQAFSRLGAWAEFIITKLYFAAFMHNEPATAYQVFEVINTRGKDLTTADLLKNFVMSNASESDVDAVYRKWEAIASNFPTEGSNNLVQYIRHVVTSYYGHVLPRELYTFLIGRNSEGGRKGPSASELVDLLEENLEPYLQMVDPSLSGPASEKQLKIFASLNQLNVIALRPILLAGQSSNAPDDVAEFALKLAIRRMVVGNLGTGNVERRFGDAARDIRGSGNVASLTRQLSDLNPKPEEFAERLKSRTLNKGLLSYLRRSAVQGDIVPINDGVLQWIWQSQDGNWQAETEQDRSWTYSIGNSVLSDQKKRLPVRSWDDWKISVLPHVKSLDEQEDLKSFKYWSEREAAIFGNGVIRNLLHVWY
jgi:hypothetical protein